jgi:hypothetical protein
MSFVPVAAVLRALSAPGIAHGNAGISFGNLAREGKTILQKSARAFEKAPRSSPASVVHAE